MYSLHGHLVCSAVHFVLSFPQFNIVGCTNTSVHLGKPITSLKPFSLMHLSFGLLSPPSIIRKFRSSLSPHPLSGLYAAPSKGGFFFTKGRGGGGGGGGSISIYLFITEGGSTEPLEPHTGLSHLAILSLCPVSVLPPCLPLP